MPMLHDILDPTFAPEPSSWLWMATLITVLLLLLLCAGVWILRRQASSPPSPPPPREAALTALDTLAQQPQPAHALAQLLRDYLEQAHALPRSLLPEELPQLPDSGTLSQTQRESFSQLLGETDHLRFSGTTPDPALRQALLARARTLLLSCPPQA